MTLRGLVIITEPRYMVYSEKIARKKHKEFRGVGVIAYSD